jgi:hypothetical protein
MDLSTNSRIAAEIAALRQLSLAQLLLNRRNALIVNLLEVGVPFDWESEAQDSIERL